jgi:hypothetical protein
MEILEKNRVIDFLSHSEDEKLLNGVKRFIELYNPKSMTWDEYDAKLKKSAKAIEKGEITEHSQVLNIIQEWAVKSKR